MAYTDVQTGNTTLQPRGVAVSPVNTVLTIWDPDLPETTSECFIVIIGPDDMGQPGKKKFFRGITLHGTGTARVMQFVLMKPGAAQLILEETRLMTDEASQQNSSFLPRGTKGYYYMALLAIQGRLDDFEILWDPIGEMEG